MELKARVSELLNAVLEVSKSVSTRSTLTALKGVCIEYGNGCVVRVSGTDLESYVSATISDEEVEDWFVVNCKTLLNALKSLDKSSEVEFSGGGSGKDAFVELHSGSRSFRIRCLLTEDFPKKWPAIDSLHVADVSARDLANALTRVNLCASKDTSRPVLTGICFEPDLGRKTLTLVATDSYRMGVAELDAHVRANVVRAGSNFGRPFSTASFVVPADFLAKFARRFKKSNDVVKIYLTKDSVELVTPTSRWVCRTVEGEYPNWRQLIPHEQPGDCAFDAKAVLSFIGAAQAVRENGAPIVIKLQNGTKLRCTNSEGESVEETYAATLFSHNLDQEHLTIGVNPLYLSDAIKFLGASNVCMTFRDNLKPFILRRAKDDAQFQYLLMPVRIS